MPLISPSSKEVSEYLLKSHTDYVNVWGSVHDEVDMVVPVYLRGAIMKKLVNTASLKELLDKYKISGLAMSYDVEFDATMSWTAGGSIDIYKYPLTKTEQLYFDLWQAEKGTSLSVVVESPFVVEVKEDGDVFEFDLKEVDEAWLDSLNSLEGGLDTIFLVADGNRFEYGRKVKFQLPFDSKKA